MGPIQNRRTTAKSFVPQKQEKKVEYRPARLDNLADIVQIENSSFPEPWSAMDLAREMAKPEVLTSIALSGGQTVDYIMLDTAYRMSQANVESVAVSPEARGAGVGRGLMTRAIEQAKESQAKSCSPQVEADNDPAKSLYQDLGFHQTGDLPGYYYGRDGLEMELTL